MILANVFMCRQQTSNLHLHDGTKFLNCSSTLFMTSHTFVLCNLRHIFYNLYKPCELAGSLHQKTFLWRLVLLLRQNYCHSPATPLVIRIPRCLIISCSSPRTILWQLFKIYLELRWSWSYTKPKTNLTYYVILLQTGRRHQHVSLIQGVSQKTRSSLF